MLYGLFAARTARGLCNMIRCLSRTVTRIRCAMMEASKRDAGSLESLVLWKVTIGCSGRYDVSPDAVQGRFRHM